LVPQIDPVNKYAPATLVGVSVRISWRRIERLPNGQSTNISVLQEDFERPLAEITGKLFHDVAQNTGTQVAA
jgi:hypothetical protein